MAHVAHNPVYNNSGTISREKTETKTKTTSEAEVLDLFTGEQTDLKKVRIKISTEEEQAIRLLLEHYSKTLGREDGRECKNSAQCSL